MLKSKKADTIKCSKVAMRYGLYEVTNGVKHLGFIRIELRENRFFAKDHNEYKEVEFLSLKLAVEYVSSK